MPPYLTPILGTANLAAQRGAERCLKRGSTASIISYVVICPQGNDRSMANLETFPDHVSEGGGPLFSMFSLSLVFFLNFKAMPGMLTVLVQNRYQRYAVKKACWRREQHKQKRKQTSPELYLDPFWGTV